MTRSDIYDRMQIELKEANEEPYSKSVFFKQWRKDFQNIVIPKVCKNESCSKWF